VLVDRKDTITECEALLTFSFGCCRYLVRAKDHNVLIENIDKQSKKKTNTTMEWNGMECKKDTRT
jgi:hypothetical protein